MYRAPAGKSRRHDCVLNGELITPALAGRYIGSTVLRGVFGRRGVGVFGRRGVGRPRLGLSDHCGSHGACRLLCNACG